MKPEPFRLSIEPSILSGIPSCIGVGTILAVTLSTPAMAAETTLGKYGQTQLQQETGDSVQLTCIGFLGENPPPAPGTVPLFETCGAMVHTANDLEGEGPTKKSLGLSADQLASSLQQIATEEFAATESMATEVSSNQMNTVLTRLSELRGGIRGVSIAGFMPDWGSGLTFEQERLLKDRSSLRGGAAGDDTDWSKLGFFITGNYSTGDRDGTDRTNEFDFDVLGLTAGADYRVSDNLVLGAAVSYHDIEADFDKSETVSGGSVDSDGWGGFLYGTYYQEQFYVDALVGYGSSDYTSERGIFIPSNNASIAAINETAKASPDSSDYTLSAGAGYAFTNGALSYGPYGRVTYLSVDVDDYSERGAEASGLNLRVDGEKWKSLTSVIGAQFSYTLSRGFGVLVPQGRVAWVHEFENDARTISSLYIDDPRGNRLLARTDDPDRNYFELGIGVSAVFKGGAQAFLNYDTVLGLDEVTQHIVSIGARWEY